MVFTPDVAIAPGLTIEREIVARWLSKKEIASRLDISEKHLIDIVKWEVSITPSLAVKLEYVFGISAKTWLQMDLSFQETKARIDEVVVLQTEKECYKHFCSKNIWILIKRGLIEKFTKAEDKIREVKSFMWVSLLESVQSLYLPNKYAIESQQYFRQSLMFEKNIFALSLWLRLGEKICDAQSVNTFAKSNVKKLTKEIKPFLKNERPPLEKIQELCNTYGIYFVFIEENFEKVPVKWVVRYYKDNPVLQLSNKWNKTDIFWFNFFHELGHIAQHLWKKQTLIDIESKDKVIEKIEQEADAFALSTLISDNEYDKIKENTWRVAILRAAKVNSVHASIVAGRLASDESVIDFWFKEASEFRTNVIVNG